ncbi:S-layer homology domain-containing protein [Paenibacillus sp. FSL L8-0436]|uniref:S-layer homology domain-containing protein n=1 Tax=Paenibacillus sp. FSL L8-0436 TaxID=2954686 RepID=UPI003157F6E9
MKAILGRFIIAAAAVICSTSMFCQHILADGRLPFDDISTSYAQKEIIDLYNKKLITGTSLTSFSPAKSMTRAEFITVLERLLKLDPVASPVSAFRDVVMNEWYYGPIQAAVQLNLASGTSETTFAPKRAVTRQEAAVWLAGALQQTNGKSANLTAYKDSDLIAAWAGNSVAAVSNLGLMKGDETGYFRPTDAITRQEATVLIYRVLQNKSWATELENEPQKHIVIGWQYGQTTAEYKSTILKSNVNILSPRWYFVGGTGSVTDSTDISLVSWAKTKDKEIWAMVGNRSDQEATHLMLSSVTARNTAITQLAAMVSKYGIDGLNIDFENVKAADRKYLTDFIAILAERLHGVNATLSIDVSPDLGTDWTEAFDYAALGEQVDYVVMMGYDEHYGGSVNPGSNASLPYIINAVETLLKVVSNDKVILALPFYNRDWTLKQNGTVSSSEFITFTEQNQRINTYSMKPLWNESLAQYVAGYTNNVMQHMIWIEDGRSLIAKYHFAVTKNLAGVAYWYIGGESPDIWTSISNAEKYYGYSFLNNTTP